MKKLSGCRVCILLAVGWLVFSAAGYMGKDSIYREYALDVKSTPYFQLVLLGIHDGIYPWSTAPTDSVTGTAAQTRRQEVAGAEHAAANIDDQEVNTIETAQTGEAVDGQDGNGAGGADVQAASEAEEAVREFTEVDDSYFDDALFIGDSRTVGLMEYGGLEHATFYATVGMNVYDLWEKPFCEVDGEAVTLEEALSGRQFGKIYFQMGINEMGRGTADSFMEVYAATIQRFRELQPDALLFVQDIMRVSGEKSESDPIFNNAGIDERNARIAGLADQSHIFYLNINEAVSDETGNLCAELSSDGLHLYAKEYVRWVEYLKTHGII